MDSTSEKNHLIREELLQLLSICGTLAGLCTTGVAIFRTNQAQLALSETIADDALAITALFFLICTYVIFIGLKTKRTATAIMIEKLIDILFLLGLTGMVASGFIMVYTVW